MNRSNAMRPASPGHKPHVDVVHMRIERVSDDKKSYLRALLYVSGKAVMWMTKFVLFGAVVAVLLVASSPFVWLPSVQKAWRDFPKPFRRFARGVGECMRMLWRLGRRVPIECIVTWTRVRGGLRQSATTRPAHIIADVRHRLRPWDVVRATSPTRRRYLLVGKTTRSTFELW